MKKIVSVLLVGMMVALSNIFSFSVNAAENIIPNYEVKLLLDSDIVLNSDDLLKSAYCNLFETSKNYEKTGVLYVDTEDLAFNDEGWVNRIRIKENSDCFELTYKKRYSVQNQDMDAVLNLANNEGLETLLMMKLQMRLMKKEILILMQI